MARRKPGLALMLLAGAAMAQPAVAAPAGVQQLLKQAEFWRERGRPELEKAALNRVLAIDPSNAAARRSLGLPPVKGAVAPPKETKAPVAADRAGRLRAAGFRALDKGDLKRAEGNFRDALALAPTDAEAAGGLGLVRLKAKDFAEARDLLTRASAGGNRGKWAEAFASASFYADFHAAERARDEGRLPEAAAKARALAASGGTRAKEAQVLLDDISARQGRVAHALAADRLRTGDVEGAERSFVEALDLNAADPWVRHDYARLLISKGRMADAERVIAPLSESQAPEALYAAALVTHDLSGPQAAMALLDRMPKDKRSAETTAYIQRLKTEMAIAEADRLRRDGHSGDALAVLRAAWVEAPGDIDLLAASARVYQSAGMNAKALDLHEEVLAARPGDTGALIGAIDTASMLHRRAQADAAVARSLQVADGNPEVHLAAARAERAKGDDRAALRHLKQARERLNGVAAGSADASARAVAVSAGVGSDPFDAPVPLTSPAEPPARGLAVIDSDIAALAAELGPRIDVSTSFRRRTGDKGLGRLVELGAKASLSFALDGGRAGFGLAPVTIDAGRPSGWRLGRFGSNGLVQAMAIAGGQPLILAPAGRQGRSGLGLSADYEGRVLKADIGTTPLGFGRTNVQGRISWSPPLAGPVTARLQVDRRPVTESVTAYAGSIDPVTGLRWGQVMKTGGGVSLSYDRLIGGVYADVSAYALDGRRVRKNDGVAANLGSYARVIRAKRSTVTAGLNLNYQSYGNNQNFFSLGHGGYFSPQRFFSIGIPLTYKGTLRAWTLEAAVTPGYQSYRQQGAAVFPDRPDLQIALDQAATLSALVLARYGGETSNGFGVNTWASANYQVDALTRLGGELRFNTFGAYKEFQTLVTLRLGFGGEGQ